MLGLLTDLAAQVTGLTTTSCTIVGLQPTWEGLLTQAEAIRDDRRPGTRVIHSLFMLGDNGKVIHSYKPCCCFYVANWGPVCPWFVERVKHYLTLCSEALRGPLDRSMLSCWWKLVSLNNICISSCWVLFRFFYLFYFPSQKWATKPFWGLSFSMAPHSSCNPTLK